MNQPNPQPSVPTASPHQSPQNPNNSLLQTPACPFTSCRVILAPENTFMSCASLKRHLNNLHLKTPALWQTGTSAQHNVLRFRPDGTNLPLFSKCLRVASAPCATKACTRVKRPRPSSSPTWRGGAGAPPTRTHNATVARIAAGLNSPPATNISAPRALPTLTEILLSPLRTSDVYSELPGPILNRAALFALRLLRDAHFEPTGSPAEDTALTKLSMAYQITFRKSLRGESE